VKGREEDEWWLPVTTPKKFWGVTVTLPKIVWEGGGLPVTLPTENHNVELSIFLFKFAF